LADRGHLVAGIGERLVETRDLHRHLCGRDIAIVDVEMGRMDQARPPEGHPARAGLALQDDTGSRRHWPSSKRRANRSAAASIAAASSGPSRRNSTLLPNPAASIITPMMLLALTSRPR